MELNEYQIKARKTNITPEKYDILYPSIALAGEVGEICNHVQKHMRSDGKIPIDKLLVAKELGDILWYLSELSWEIGYTLEDIALMNLEKLASRKMRGKLEGNGDER